MEAILVTAEMRTGGVYTHALLAIDAMGDHGNPRVPGA